MVTLRKMLSIPLVLLLLAALLLAACDDSESGGGGQVAQPSGPPDLTIVSGSENRTIEPIIQEWASQEGVNIQIDYLGSLDIMLEIEDGVIDYDAVWPANSIWLDLGDQYGVVKHTESILRSPVVLGVKKSIAENLGWVGAEVSTADILEAAENKDIRMMMTSATQSNSGASAYFAFLYAFADQPDVLTSEDLQNPDVAAQIKRILGAVDRSSGSSGWLMDLCYEHYEDCDAMVNYEALIIEINQELTTLGKEPLYAVYPTDGLAVADSPLGYVDKDDAAKEELFLKLQEFLLSDETQQKIIDLGRRAGKVGMSMSNANQTVFNPAWGIDPARTIVPITFPKADVIREALVLYQTTFRKPSFTVYALDFSGSMTGDGQAQLKEAMRVLLDQERAADYLLQASPEDITVVLLFDDEVINAASYGDWTVTGNDPAELNALLEKIIAMGPQDNTNIYAPVELALDIFMEMGVGNRFPAVILMTDGQSNAGSFSDLQAAYQQSEYRVPVFGILFGGASEQEVARVANLTTGRVFDGKDNLIEAFRQAKGYN